MSIILDLPPQIETLLRQRAETTGQDIRQLAIAVLTLGLSMGDEEFFESIEGIQRSFNDIEWIEEVRAKVQVAQAEVASGDRVDGEEFIAGILDKFQQAKMRTV